MRWCVVGVFGGGVMGSGLGCVLWMWQWQMFFINQRLGHLFVECLNSVIIVQINCIFYYQNTLAYTHQVEVICRLHTYHPKGL